MLESGIWKRSREYDRIEMERKVKIIHCADLHLDSRMTTHLTKEKAKERKAEILKTFLNMVEYAEENQVRAILIAGDLFDVGNISAVARNTVYNAVKEHPGIQFFYLRGNHDEGNSFLQTGEHPENLRLFSDSWCSYVLEEGEKRIVITAVEQDTVHTRSIADSLTLRTEDFNIVMLHGQDREHETKEMGGNISLRSFRKKGIDYLALGHIHSYKRDRLDARGRYCYPGCLEGRGFDECGEHGFVLLEIDGEGSCTDHFIPFASRKLYTLHVDISECMTTPMIGQCIQEVLDREGYAPESMVKIQLEGRVDMECEKDISYLEKWLEGRYYFLKIKDNSRIKADYSQYAKAASLKGEFVRTVMDAEGVGEEEKAWIIKYGIWALAEEMERDG